MSIEKYFVRNVETGEKIEVLPHTAGEETFGFVDATLAGTEAWTSPETLYTFENANKDGAFTSPESEQLDATGAWDFVTETE